MPYISTNLKMIKKNSDELRNTLTSKIFIVNVLWILCSAFVPLKYSYIFIVAKAFTSIVHQSITACGFQHVRFANMDLLETEKCRYINLNTFVFCNRLLFSTIWLYQQHLSIIFFCNNCK